MKAENKGMTRCLVSNANDKVLIANLCYWWL